MKSLITAMLLLTAFTSEAAQGKSNWAIKQVTGPGWGTSRMALVVDVTQVSFVTSKKETLLTIPANQITQVVYSQVRFNRKRMLGEGFPTCGVGGCGGGEVFLWAALAASSTMHGRSHYITLSWTDREVEQQLEFEVRKSDIKALSVKLRGIVGSKWVNLGEHRREIESLVTEHRNEAVAVEIERDSWCGAFAFPKGTYRILAMQKGLEADVYFFAGTVTISQLRGALHAKVTDADGAPGLAYLPNSSNISSMGWQNKLLVFSGM